MARDHGDGGIDPRGKDRWRLRYRVGGKRYTKTVRGSLTDAKRELRALFKSGDDGLHVEPAKLTVAQWVKIWLPLREGKISARTLERYQQLLDLHVIPKLGETRIQFLTPTMIDQLYKELSDKGLSQSTVRYVHVVLGSCMRGAEAKNAIPRNPVSRADAPKVGDADVATVLEQDEFTKLVTGFRGSPLFPLVAVAAFTGARRGEILALRWSDLDSEAKTLRIERAIEETKKHGLRLKAPKTKRGFRTIAIDAGLIAVLLTERERHQRIMAGIPDGSKINPSLVKLPPDALIFPAPPHAGVSFDFSALRRPRHVTKAFERKASALGFKNFRFHDLRATHETMLLDEGVPVHVVAARCGHDPAVLLRVYAKRTRKADNSAAAVIDILSREALRVS